MSSPRADNNTSSVTVLDMDESHELDKEIVIMKTPRGIFNDILCLIKAMCLLLCREYREERAWYDEYTDHSEEEKGGQQEQAQGGGEEEGEQEQAQGGGEEGEQEQGGGEGKGEQEEEELQEEEGLQQPDKIPVSHKDHTPAITLRCEAVAPESTVLNIGASAGQDVPEATAGSPYVWENTHYKGLVYEDEKKWVAPQTVLHSDYRVEIVECISTHLVTPQKKSTFSSFLQSVRKAFLFTELTGEGNTCVGNICHTTPDGSVEPKSIKHI